MQISTVRPPVHNALVADYFKGDATLQTFFEYPFHQDAFQKRLQEISKNQYQRQALAQCIEQEMASYGVSPKAKQHIKALADGGYAVVGGQQAGVFTGPLYAVHKAITVIQLARQQSEALQVPVVPVFWIAGEDHDIDEINHTYTLQDTTIEKRTYKDRFIEKTMASTTKVTEQKLQELVDIVVADYGEQTFTKAVKAQLDQATKAKTFTDFFMMLMTALFADEGLLFIDAANPQLRQLEADYFTRLITHAEEIAHVVVEQEQALQQAGYGTPIMAQADAANLFYVDKGARYLLKRESSSYICESKDIRFTYDELMAIAQDTPEKLSNNVVTRPLMQEMVLPVLAFVGGPGEMAYWATLKPAFQILGLTMPIFAPRLHITLVTRRTQFALQQLDLTVEDVFQGKDETEREQFITKQTNQEALQQLDEITAMLQEQYASLQTQLSPALQRIAKKNTAYHQQQIAYLMKKIQQETMEKHQAKLRQYELVRNELLPNGGLQERVYNPYQFIAFNGTEWVKNMCAINCEIDSNHYVVLL